MPEPAIFPHTSRSFLDVFNAFKGKYPKKPDFLFKDFAGFFETISIMQNNGATDILDPFTRESATSRANLSSYTVIQADGASAPLNILLTSPIAKTLAIGYQVAGLSTNGILNIYELTAVGDSGGTDTINVAAKQKKTVTDLNIGAVPTSKEFIEIPIDGQRNIIKATFSATIAAIAWTRVDNFDDSTDTDKHFVLIFQSSGRVRMLFGDGVRGEIPPQGQTTLATFEVTNGLKGQMDKDEININTGGDSDIATVGNDATTGGNDAESVASIVRNAQTNARLRDAVFTKEDIESACRQADSSVIKALGIPGIGSATAQIVPSSFGQPGAPLISTVETFVISKTQFKLMPFSVITTDFKLVDIDIDFIVRAGFVASIVKKLVEFAMTIASSARDNMTLENFDDFGIDSARTNIINVVYPLSGTWGFAAAENDALTKVIESYRSTLATGKKFRFWGDPLEFGSLFIIGESLIDFGVQTVNITNPLGNVNTDSTTQIIDNGTITATDVT